MLKRLKYNQFLKLLLSMINHLSLRLYYSLLYAKTKIDFNMPRKITTQFCLDAFLNKVQRVSLIYHVTNKLVTRDIIIFM